MQAHDLLPQTAHLPIFREPADGIPVKMLEVTIPPFTCRKGDNLRSRTANEGSHGSSAASCATICRLVRTTSMDSIEVGGTGWDMRSNREVPEAATGEALGADLGPTALDQIRSRVTDAIEGRLDQAEHDIWEAVLANVPAYRILALDTATADEVRSSVRALVRVFVGCVREARPLTADELAVMHAVGARRASQGLAPDDLRDAAQVALKVGLRHLHDDIKTLGNNHLTYDAAREIADVLDDFVNAFAEVATRSSRADRHQEGDGRANERATLLDQILDGAITGDLALKDAGAVVGPALDTPCTLIVMTCRKDTPRSLEGPMALLARGPGTLLRGPERFEPLPHVVGVASGSTPGELSRRAREVATACDVLVFAERVTALPGLASTYHWACELLSVPLGPWAAGITELDEVVPYWLVSKIPAGADLHFVKQTIGPLLASDQAAHGRTLQAARAYLAAEGSIEGAAAALGVDRRTVHRYIARFESLTGRSLRQPSQLLRVQHALHLLDLRGATLPPPGDPAWNVND